MNLDLKKELKITVQELALIVALSTLLGAIFWIFAPLLIFGLIVFFVGYVGFTLYDAITRRTHDKIQIR